MGVVAEVLILPPLFFSTYGYSELNGVGGLPKKVILLKQT